MSTSWKHPKNNVKKINFFFKPGGKTEVNINSLFKCCRTKETFNTSIERDYRLG